MIARLDQEFGHRVRVEALLWEREPLVASRHFQDIGNIPAPHTADIVVVIVWSRLGVLLPPEQFSGAISGRPVTGTEWEFEDALASARKNGTPPILFYRKQAELTTGLSDRAALQEKIEQLDRVDDFIGRWFRGTDGQTASAAWHSFSTTGEFEDPGRRASARAAHQTPRRREWRYGALARLAVSRAGVVRVRACAGVFRSHPGAQRVARGVGATGVEGLGVRAVLGASGSGKSSLVKAGLVPDLMLPGMIGRVALCRRAVLRPGDQPDDLMRGLAAAIMAPTALPELAQLRYTPERLADLLREAPKQAILPIEQGLAEAAKAAALTKSPRRVWCCWSISSRSCSRSRRSARSSAMRSSRRWPRSRNPGSSGRSDDALRLLRPHRHGTRTGATGELGVRVICCNSRTARRSDRSSAGQRARPACVSSSTRNAASVSTTRSSGPPAIAARCRCCRSCSISSGGSARPATS